MKPSPVLFLVAGAGILAALFYGLKPRAPEAVSPPAAVPITPASPLPTAPETLPAPPAERVLEFRIQAGKRVQGPELIQLRQGDRLRLKITSDADDELHIHGYEQHAHLHAGKTAELEVIADHSGRFEVELHKSHLQLAVLEVQPR